MKVMKENSKEIAFKLDLEEGIPGRQYLSKSTDVGKLLIDLRKKKETPGKWEYASRKGPNPT